MFYFISNMAKKLKLLFVAQTLAKQGYALFTKLEFQRLFRVSKTAATFFLFRHTRSGLFVRLKNGLYALAEPLPSEEEIANRLYQPSYLSFEYVLSRHGVIPEAVYTITSATTKPSREFEIEGKIYAYHTLKNSAYSGFEPHKKNAASVLIATPEKALVDYLYFVALKKKPLNDRFHLQGLSKKTVLSYAKLFEYPKLELLIRRLL